MAKIVNTEFKDFNGTENYYKTMIPNLYYTDGVKAVADSYQCYWFIDIIVSYFNHAKLVNEEFQVWRLERVKGDKFIVKCSDGDWNLLLTQKIPFSDFKGDVLTFWKVRETILLPNEY